MKIRKLSGYGFLAVLMAVAFAVPASAGTQAAALSPDNVVVSAGESAELVLTYDVITDGAKKTTGLGLRIHFNSAVIESLSFEDVYGAGWIAQDEVAQDDKDDLDEDPATDKYVGIAWVGMQGDWPNLVELPAALAKVVVKVKADAAPGLTQMNITASGTAAGYNFTATGAAVTIP